MGHKTDLALALLAALALPSPAAFAAEAHQQVILDDGSGANPPDAPMGTAANPVAVTPGIAAPAFIMPGPSVLGRWRVSCHCFVNPP